jgi:hypothetical protein
VPTIFIYGYPNPRLEQQVLQSGAIAYLRKPFKRGTVTRIHWRRIKAARRLTHAAMIADGHRGEGADEEKGRSS